MLCALVFLDSEDAPRIADDAIKDWNLTKLADPRRSDNVNFLLQLQNSAEFNVT